MSVNASSLVISGSSHAIALQSASMGSERVAWLVVTNDGTGQLGWIAARIENKFYIEGVGVNLGENQDKGADPCRGFIGTPDEITFYYDRTTAVDYSIAQSYQNDVVSSPGNGRVSSRLDFTTAPRITAFFQQQPLIPFADFDYGTNISRESGRTGSAVFMSEALWMGGLPMTIGESNSCTTIEVNSGWQYCSEPNLTAASKVWSVHKGIVAYYTDSIPPQSGATSNNLLESWGNIVGTEVSIITSTDINPLYITLLKDGGNLVVDAAGLALFMKTELVTSSHAIVKGDYVWINTPDPHGFLIAGWGEISNIPSASGMSSCDDLLASSANGTLVLYSSVAEAQQAGKTNVVPFVVDFPGNLQNPIARPFYCTWYLQSEYYRAENLPIPNLAEDGGFARDPIGDYEGYLGRHNWFFYRLSDSITIEFQNLYPLDEWIWSASDGNPIQ